MSRSRSPNYPSMNLGEAIEAARPIFGKDGRNKMSRLTVAKHLGYSSLNGRSLAKLGALRSYGLLDGTGDELRVSEACVALLRAPNGSEERANALREAFNSPALFRELNAECPGQISKENLIWKLDQKNFTPDAADRAASTYLESLALVSQRTDSYNPADTGKGKASSHSSPSSPPRAGSASESRSAGYALMDNERLVFTEEDTPQQYIKLVASGSVSTELLDALEAYVKRQRSRLKKADASPNLASESQDAEEGNREHAELKIYA